MSELQKEFEELGQSCWINLFTYPHGKIYSKEYTEWLEKKVNDLKRLLINSPESIDANNTKE